VIATQGIQGIAFFEATACLTLLVLFVHLQRDNPGIFYKLWILGWVSLTVSSFSELGFFFNLANSLHVLSAVSGTAALALFLASIVQFTLGQNRFFLPMVWLSGLLALTAGYYEAKVGPWGHARWESTILQSVVCITAGWLLWRVSNANRGHGTKLLAGAFTLLALNNIDRPQWTSGEMHLLRFAFDHFLTASLGIGMIVLLLEAARTRSLEISEKMRQFTLLTASSSQSVSLPVLLQKVLGQLTGSIGVTHGIVRLREGEGDAAEFVCRASVGYSENYLKQMDRLAASSPWVQSVIQELYRVSRFEDEKDPKIRRAMADAGITQLISVPLRGKKGVVGILNIGALPGKRFHEDELTYLANVASFLGTTVENVNLFEQIKTVQQQWVYTFDSIGDPILVHDNEGRIMRGNLRLANLLGKDFVSVVGRSVSDLFSARAGSFKVCPYCEGTSGDADSPDPWLQGFFLASNSVFSDPAGRQLGTIHVLKDITERKRAEEKYRNLVASV
jgi:PAS domain-containing protein